MRRLLRYACWDADAVRDDLRACAVDHLGTDGAVPIVDETGFVKKGHASAGVRRQYTGTAGRIEYSRAGVFLAYATERGRALIDRRLSPPEHSWSNDIERRREAGIPEDVQFATKPRLAWEMIETAPDARITTSWVTGDEAYGQDPHLRLALEVRETGYVPAVACSTTMRINQGRAPARADTVAGTVTSPSPCSPWPSSPPWPSPARHPAGQQNRTTPLRNVSRYITSDRPGDPSPAHCGLTPPAITTATQHWSSWRRHHQSAARRGHYRRRSLRTHQMDQEAALMSGPFRNTGSTLTCEACLRPTQRIVGAGGATTSRSSAAA